MKLFTSTLFILVSSLIFSQEKTTSEYNVLVERIGDLNNDGIDEKVQVLDTSGRVCFHTKNGSWTSDYTVKIIHLYKFKKGKWKLWKKLDKALSNGHKSFKDLRIENGVLYMSYELKTSSRHKRVFEEYSFNNNQFELSKYTVSLEVFRHQYFVDYEINLLNGLTVYNKRFKDSTKKPLHERFYIDKPERHNLKNFNSVMRFKTPKHQEKIALKISQSLSRS